MAKPKTTQVQCPICGNMSDFFADPLGPFCSQRCKLIDLGQWFNEGYRISEPLRADNFEEFQHLDGDELDQPERDAP